MRGRLLVEWTEEGQKMWFSERVEAVVFGGLMLVSPYRPVWRIMTRLNQKLSPTSCIIIAEYRGTLYKIIHEYTIIFGHISPIYARERHFLRYIIGDNYRR